MRVRIHVTPGQNRALVAVAQDAPDADQLHIADFTATFSMPDPVGWLEARMAEWPRAQFPRASLHGVARKLASAIRSQVQPDLQPSQEEPDLGPASSPEVK